MVGVSREPEEEKPFERSMESDSKGKKKKKKKTTKKTKIIVREIRVGSSSCSGFKLFPSVLLFH